MLVLKKGSAEDIKNSPPRHPCNRPDLSSPPHGRNMVPPTRVST
ncbi:hypothetical protein EVA_07273 [gut metagenome]|uniref:Uncharacterized protein n=1 Tax=gut metagenome TaxID=749906 RepID=J9GCM8_9ZZZZ